MLETNCGQRTFSLYGVHSQTALRTASAPGEGGTTVYRLLQSQPPLLLRWYLVLTVKWQTVELTAT